MTWPLIMQAINSLLSVNSQILGSQNESLGVIGYEHCPKINPNMLNVHIAAHTHDDVGWVKTIDEYFTGNDGVEHILDNVLEALEENPERKFVYVEMSFFSKWWNLRNEAVHQRIINLVNNGQLQFVGGGWCMADEATTSYSDIINQMTLGLRFLNDTFGPVATPRTIWQVDPFGHSRETASLTARMGFDGLFIGRLDIQDKQHRQETRTMEFLWNASNSLGLRAQLFTGVLSEGYYPPHGNCVDCGSAYPGSVNDDHVKQFVKHVKELANYYTSNNIMLTMGGDFHYKNARRTFQYLDELIKATNNNHSVNAIYSTPSCYLFAVNQASKEYTIKTDDFMPYTDNSRKYWTGYYTSRPTFKELVKYAGNVLNIARQLTTYANQGQKNLELLSRYQSDSQHHDSITGTAKQAVSNDYTKRLAIGLTSANMAINEALMILISKNKTVLPPQQICYYLNISYCNATEKVLKFILTVYNPLGQSVVSHVRVPVAGSLYSVRGPDGTPVSNELVPVPKHVLSHPVRNSSATNDLVFNVKLPPSGLNSYFIESTVESIVLNHYPKFPSTNYIENENLLVRVDATTGLLESVTNKETGKRYNIRQNFYYYIGIKGSGAYSFLPAGDAQIISHTATITIMSGKEVQEIHQTFSAYVSLVIRLYPGEKKVEFEWMVGPIPTENSYAKEIISRYNSDLKNGGLFYTDSNGREMIERKLNYRPTWDIKLSQNISGNYYPISNSIYIRDVKDDVQMTIITDRAEGGSSLSDGAIELMVHRRLLMDDGYGVDEALNERDVDGSGLRARGKHWLTIGTIAESSRLHRMDALSASNPPLVLINANSDSFDNYEKSFKTTYTGLTRPLPDNVHLLTVEKLADGSVLLRFEHYFEISNSSGQLSKPVNVDIKKLFTEFEIVSMRETVLSANMWLSDLNRLKWNNPVQKNDGGETQKESNDMVIHLQPMQIRTFIAIVRYY